MSGGACLAAAGVMLALARAGAAAAEENAGGAQLVVRIWDRIPVASDVWEGAKRIVEETFEPVGIRIDWKTCGASEKATCGAPAAPREIGLRVFRPSARERRSTGHFTAGAALATDRESGQGIVYVLFDRVESVARDGRIPPSLVLAITVAHEIGHVLLPPGHSQAGVMKAHLDKRDWRAAAKGWLNFSEDDGRRLRERVRRGPARSVGATCLHPAG